RVLTGLLRRVELRLTVRGRAFVRATTLAPNLPTSERYAHIVRAPGDARPEPPSPPKDRSSIDGWRGSADRAGPRATASPPVGQPHSILSRPGLVLAGAAGRRPPLVPRGRPAEGRGGGAPRRAPSPVDRGRDRARAAAGFGAGGRHRRSADRG